MSRRRLLLVAMMALAVIAATAVYFYRDGIARRAANSVLAGTGLTIASLSINEIGSRFVNFDELVVALCESAR